VWDAYNGTKSRSGYPWHFLTRDILQFDPDIDSALSRIANTQRTCSIWIGLGDYTNQFRAVGYSYDYIDIYDDMNYPSYLPVCLFVVFQSHSVGAPKDERSRVH
jgi:hypothetical protein